VAGRRIRAGTPAPPIGLVDVFTGGMVSLAAFRGRRVLVVFVTADCDPCDDVIAALAAPARPDGPQVLLVSRGGVAATRHKLAGYDIGFPVVVQDHWEVSRRYGAFTFPAAVLVDEAGVVARDMFRADEIPALLATPEYIHTN
jgi:peroxiredoxin